MLSNTIKYTNITKNGSFALVDVNISEKQAAIRVENNRIGIEEKYIKCSFNMFMRVSEKSDVPGPGLYIVKQIIEKLDGSIQ